MRLGEKYHPDVAPVDLMLPDLSGTEVLRSLRHAMPSTVVIMITGFGTKVEVAEALRLGAADWLDKLVDTNDLLEVVNRFASPSRNTTPSTHHADARWAAMMVRAIHCDHDVRTIRDWARQVNASFGGCVTGAESPACRRNRRSSWRA